MKFSIITPTYNSASTIEKNIFSVITQSYKNYEHIIVDNLSKDDTLKKVRATYERDGLNEKLNLISEQDSGISNAFNKGVYRSTGDIIAILNSDDFYYYEDLFADVAKEFELNSACMIVYGDILFKDDVYGTNVRRPLPIKAVNGIHFNHPAMFVRKVAYNSVGLYNEKYKFAMDVDFFYRIALKYKLNDSSIYLYKKPMTVMNAGGASWKNEVKALDECKDSLKTLKKWNSPAKTDYYTRRFRTALKSIITSLKLEKLIRIWRKMKWGN